MAWIALSGDMRCAVYQRKEHQENRTLKHASSYYLQPPLITLLLVKDGYTSLLNKSLIFLIANPCSIIIIGEIPLYPYFVPRFFIYGLILRIFFPLYYNLTHWYNTSLIIELLCILSCLVFPACHYLNSEGTPAFGKGLCFSMRSMVSIFFFFVADSPFSVRSNISSSQNMSKLPCIVTAELTPVWQTQLAELTDHGR